MKKSQLKLCLCFLDNDNIIKSSKDLGVTYDLNGDHKILNLPDAEIELIEIILYQISISLKQEVIREMLEEITEGLK